MFLNLFACASLPKKDAHAIHRLPQNITLRENWKPYFDSCGVDGAMAIYAMKSKQWLISDTHAIANQTLPASTFKIINLLIALETNTIKDEYEIVKWPGYTDTVKYGYRPDIYHDMSVKEAFELSAGWVFVELSKKIGKTTYQKYLSASNYGNGDLSQTDPDFWNFGNFKISPLNQVQFLKDLLEEKVPFSKRNIAIVKNVMLTEQTNAYSLHAKTGWTRENNINTGWWTGYLITENETYLFSTRLLQDRNHKRDDFGSCRKEITKKIFNSLGIKVS